MIHKKSDRFSPPPGVDVTKPTEDPSAQPVEYTGDPGMETPVNKTPTAPRASAPSQYPRSTAIQQMQTALQSLYGAFKNYPMFNKKPNYREEDKGQKGAEYTESFEHGSDSFLTTMMNRHVNKADMVGTPDMSVQDAKEGKSFDLIKLLESLKTFGKGLNKPDGAWGPYTNNALKNLYAITQAMLGVLSNLNVRQDVYTNKDLEELKENIPEDPKKIQDADASATAITKNIAKVKMLLGSFVNATVGENSKLAPYINQQKPFETTFNKKPVDSRSLVGYNVSQSQVPVLNIQVPRDPMHPEQGTVPLLLGNLATPQDFKEFVNKSGIMVDHKKPSDKESMNKIIETIENKIKTVNTKTPATNEPGY
jgi:hypothetical protein